MLKTYYNQKLKKYINKKNLLILCLIFCLYCLYFLSFGCFLCLFPASYQAYAYSYTTYPYAQIRSDNTYLYKTPNSLDLTNVYFALPNSYFVLLISNYDNNFYKVEYRDLVGFVLKDEVVAVNEKPQKPYLTDISFRVFSSDGVKVMSSPFENAYSVETLEVMSQVDYYGFTIGYEKIENRGSVWFYGKTLSGSTGYFYKGLCDNLTNIPLNTESVTPLTSHPFEDNDNSYLYNLISLTPALKVILILLVTVPSVFLILLLFLPHKIKKQKLLKLMQNQKSKTTKLNTKTNKENHKKPARKQNSKNKNIVFSKTNKSKRNLKNQTINKIQRIIDDDTL